MVESDVVELQWQGTIFSVPSERGFLTSFQRTEIIRHPRDPRIELDGPFRINYIFLITFFINYIHQDVSKSFCGGIDVV